MCLHHKQMQMVKWLIIIQEAYSKHWIFDASYFAARSTLFSMMPELKTESFKKKKKIRLHKQVEITSHDQVCIHKLQNNAEKPELAFSELYYIPSVTLQLSKST